jgi:uncharacterized membrane-anchored protein
MAKKKEILYDPTLEVEKKEFFVGTKLGKKLSGFKKYFEGLPAGVQWFFTLLLSSIISGLVGVAVMIYFNIGVKTIEDMNMYLKVQFIFDLVVVITLVVFIWLLIKEAKS